MPTNLTEMTTIYNSMLIYRWPAVCNAGPASKTTPGRRPRICHGERNPMSEIRAAARCLHVAEADGESRQSVSQN